MINRFYVAWLRLMLWFVEGDIARIKDQQRGLTECLTDWSKR